VKYGVENATK